MSEAPEENAERRIERRHAARFNCNLDITIEWGAAALRGRVRDISVGGMFVELDSPLWIGARFAAELGLPQPVQLDCIVRRVQPHRGMALSYSAAADSGRAAIESLIQEMTSR